MLVGFFLLFELSKWQTYLIVLLNFAVLFGAHYLLANYINPSHSFGSRPQGRPTGLRIDEPTPTAVLCNDCESGLRRGSRSGTLASSRGSAMSDSSRSMSIGLDIPTDGISGATIERPAAWTGLVPSPWR